MVKNSIIKGTLILTLAGLLTRIIGFFYKIYLSNMLGPENLGIYQLVFPIYGICFTLYASGIQTSISNMVAAEYGRLHLSSNKNRNPSFKNFSKILKIGLIFSVSIAICLSFLVYHYADFISTQIVMEPSLSPSLKILAYIFPFCGITSCINGYYYGLKKAGVPAVTQLLEQIVRVISVYFIALYAGKGNQAVTCELAVFGVVLGEIASNIYNILSLAFAKKSKGIVKNQSTGYIAKSLAKLAVPLTSNRLLISILNSFESILIPNMLKKAGLSTADALSIYGILTGMSMPFIMFPSAITNSLAVLLLPTVSEAHASNNEHYIDRTTSLTIQFSLLIGIFSTGVFMIFGDTIGQTIFHNNMAGNFLVTLSWLCPFLYLTTTLGSIINGLGKTHLTFFNSVIGLSIRILFILYMVPNKGISGYLIGLLVSQLAISLLDGLAIYRNVHVDFNTINWLVKPCIILCFIGFFIKKVYSFMITTGVNQYLLLFLSCLILLVLYILLLFTTKAISKNTSKV